MAVVIMVKRWRVRIDKESGRQILMETEQPDP